MPPWKVWPMNPASRSMPSQSTRELGFDDLLGAGKREQVAGPLLRVRGAHGFQHHGLGHGLGAALHGTRGVDADQHRAHLRRLFDTRRELGRQAWREFVLHVGHAVVVLVAQQRAFGMARMPDQAQARMQQQHRLGRQHARHPPGAAHAQGLARVVGDLHDALDLAHRQVLLHDAHVAVIRRVRLVGLARAAELAHDAREFGQRFDQAPGADHLLPAAAAQQPAHHVPARVLHQVGVLAEDRRQLVHRVAAVFPVRGESLQRPGRGLVLAVAAVPVVDDHVQVEAQRAQHRLGEGRLAFAVARQVGSFQRHRDALGQGWGRPLRVGGGVAFEQRRPQAFDARQARHQPPLRMDQAPQPQAPRQALQRRQRRFEALVEQGRAH